MQHTHDVGEVELCCGCPLLVELPVHPRKVVHVDHNGAGHFGPTGHPGGLALQPEKTTRGFRSRPLTFRRLRLRYILVEKIILLYT